MKLKLINLCVFWIAFFAIGTSNAQTSGFIFPEYDNIYVNDYANLLDPNTERTLTRYLKESESHGVQMSLLTINQLSDYKAGPRIEPFATALFNHWGVGDSMTNRGVLILVSRYDRQMRIELGSGYESYWDARAKKVIDNTFIPYFKSDDYQQGITNGVIKTIEMATGHAPSGANSNFFNDAFQTVKRWLKSLGGFAFLLLISAFYFFVFVANLARNTWRKRPRNCPACNSGMHLLDEVSDDRHLEGGQILEEKIESVDYDVWRCTVCPKITISRYASWFSEVGACQSCNYKTLETETTILEHATTSSSGSKQLDYRCLHCGFTDYEIRTIPRKSSSSSRSGGSGSFGGGRSSGGGASGSW